MAKAYEVAISDDEKELYLLSSSGAQICTIDNDDVDSEAALTIAFELAANPLLLAACKAAYKNLDKRIDSPKLVQQLRAAIRAASGTKAK